METIELVQIFRNSEIEHDQFSAAVDSMFEQVWGNLLPPQILTDELANRVVDNVITAAGDPIPDCLTCGACCASFVCVDVAPDSNVPSGDCWDITRQGQSGRFIVDRFIKRKESDFSCRALDGEIGHQVSCRIYEDRPRMCRQFEAGSDRCHAVRRAYGLEPFLSLDEMQSACQTIADREPTVAGERIAGVHIGETTDAKRLQITAVLKDGSRCVIHTFDPAVETWFESEFEGHNLSKAKELVASRTKKG
jgi:Fe-S-cluster containining protein